MTKQNAELTMKSTKKEMLDTYNALKDELAKKESELLNSETVKEESRKEKVVIVANEVAENDITTQINQLKSSITKNLTELVEKMDAESAKYRQLKEAIAIKEQELKMVYEVETAANDLAALIAAQKESKERFEAEMAEEKAELEKEIDETRLEFEAETTAREAEVKAKTEAENTKRQRENEDFEYNIKRERELRKNQLADEMAELEREIQNKKETFDKEVSAKTTDLDLRETEISEREKNHADLEAKVAQFPEELDAAVKNAVKANTERLSSDFTKNEELLTKDFEGQINVLNARILALEETVTSQKSRIEQLDSQQEKAYEKVQDIANKAVSSAAESGRNITVHAQTSKEKD